MRHAKRQRCGFTLVELLVVIAIIAMLMTVLLPAVQAMRGTARRAQCQNQLLQLIMAAQNYEMSHEHYPAGVTDPTSGPIQNIPEGQHQGWMIWLLPYLDEQIVYQNVDFSSGVYDAANAEVRGHVIPKFLCPADWGNRADASSSYAACHHGQEAPIDATNNGVFFLNSQITIDEVRDGLSQTIFMGEKLLESRDLGWMSGTRATLRNTGSPINRGRGVMPMTAGDSDSQPAMSAGEPESEIETADPSEAGGDSAESTPSSEEPRQAEEEPSPDEKLFVGGFGSAHPSGAHVVFGDGRIQFATSQIDARVFQLLGNRDDGTLLDVEDYRE